MFSFLNIQNFNFDFVGDSIPDSGRTGKKKTSSSNGKRESGKQLWLWESHGSSSSSSPTANSTANMTPRTEPVVTPPPKRAPLDCPAARPETERAKRRSLSQQSALRNNNNEQRRSSVFFRLPDLDKILKGDNANSSSSAEAAAAGRKKDGRRASRSANGGKGHDQGMGGGDGDFGHSLAAKLSRPVSGRRRGRRASVAPGGSSPGRTRADRLAAAEEEARNAAAAAAERSTCVLDDKESQEEGSAGTTPETAAAGGNGGPPFFESKPDSLLLTVGEEEEVLAPAPTAAAEGDALHQKQQQQQDDRSRDQKRPSPRSSPRALSAGHRRESCRDGRVISRAPKGLSAARLLEDAQDVARIRSQAGLRAKMEGVCWIASNWCVGGRKGVLSGKRFLVLCDNIVWAELREADRRCSIAAGSVVSGGGQGGTTRTQAAGFMPLIALEGASIQHCDVANSNNGWIIEVVNPSENVTLWLDPENATALLRWGSVLCQALQTERYDGKDDE
ncbi:unnamed protein product [Ectocarpus sp. 4 AP-2014]